MILKRMSHREHNLTMKKTVDFIDSDWLRKAGLDYMKIKMCF